MPLANFREGIKHVPGFFGGETKNILNQEIDDNGFLVPRKGIETLEDRLIGMYPRSVQRFWKTEDATDATHIHFSGDTLRIGLATSPSQIAAFNADTTLVIIRGNLAIEVDIQGTTLTVINENTAVLSFSASGGAGLGNLEDGDSVHVVILKDDTEQILYRDGDQFVVAHWLGDETNDPVTRYYRFPKNTHWEQIQRGKILLLADGEHPYFIHVQENKRYDWTLKPPQIARFQPRSDESAAAIRARVKITNAFLYENNATRQWLWKAFPHDRLRRTSDSAPAQDTYYAALYKATYTYEGIGIESKASAIYVDVLSPAQALAAWLSDENIVDNSGTEYETRLDALVAENVITTAERTTLQVEIDNQLIFTFKDFDDRPDWAQDINIYRNVEYLSTVAEISEREVPTNAGWWDRFFSGFVEFVTHFGLNLIIGNDDNPDTDTRVYREINRELVNSIPDENFRLHTKRRITGIENDTIAIPNSSTEVVDVFLDAIYNESPPESLDAITIHAGRIYGINRETEEVIFSHIGGTGASNYFAFPVVNAIETSASGIAPIETLEKMPNSGGIYVFKRDSIHYIDGQNIFSGLYNINVSAHTDISAADYRKNIGCISPRSVKNDGNSVLFLGSDDQIYVLAGKNATPIGVNVKPFIEDLEISELKDVVTAWHNERFYLTLPDSVLILNTERKYWTRFDWQLKDMFWSRGGKTAESVFYGLTTDDDLVELLVDRGDQVFPTEWESNIEVLPTHALFTGIYVYTEDSKEIAVTVSGNEPPKEITRTFTPKLSNKYRAGMHVKGRNINVKIRSEEPVTIDRITLEENY